MTDTDKSSGTSTGTLREALEREHHDIDAGIEAYVAGSANGDASPAPLIGAMAALRRHIYLEEEFLFPPLREAGMMAPIFVMLREHGELWSSMDGLEKLLAKDSPHDLVTATCTVLLAQLERHNTKEEPILYGPADQTLSEDARAQLQDFLNTSQLPVGWVCQTAPGH